MVFYSLINLDFRTKQLSFIGKPKDSYTPTESIDEKRPATGDPLQTELELPLHLKEQAEPTAITPRDNWISKGHARKQKVLEVSELSREFELSGLTLAFERNACA
jgi:hypothetical protein